MPPSARADVRELELEIAATALTTFLDHIVVTAEEPSDGDLLARAVPCCIQVAGLLAVLTGRLATLADALYKQPADGVGPAAGLMGDISADLDTMRNLLHRATLVGAPALADLRRPAAGPQKYVP